MQSSPVVSVVSAFYNRARYVNESIGSLLDQTLREIEIIVVDDGSTDDTAAELARIADPRLKPIIQENSGFVTAMNRAVRASSGRYVAVHGSGDISRPERLEKQAAFLDAHPEVGAVGCARNTGARVTGPAGGVLERGSMLEVMLKRNPFSHGEVMFRRELFDRVGGYREVFKFAQDRDLWLRMGQYCDYAVLPDLLYERRLLENGVTKSPQNFYLQTKLSQFAVQSARRRDAKGRDLLEQYGPAAFFLSQPSRKLSRQLSSMGIRLIRNAEWDGALVLLQHAWREDRNPYSLAGLFLGKAGQRKMLQGPIHALFKRLKPRTR